MTISNQTSKNVFVGDTSTLIFSYTFRIFVDADLEVTIQDTSVTPQTEKTLVLTTDYTVSGAGNLAGGNVTLVLGGQLTVAPIATDNITIRRDLLLTQPTDYVENDPFPAAAHEDVVDRSRMIDQQLQEEIDRSLKLSVNITGVEVTLPTPLANAPIGWDAAATGLTNNPTNTNLSQIDTAATPDFIGATAATGVIRTGSNITYTDGGNFVTLDTVQAIAVTSSPTFAGITLSTLTMTTAVTSILDEDTQVSNSATALVTQQSIKAYVDSQVAASDTFIEMTDTPANYTGDTIKFVRVNVGETALEFVTLNAALVPIVDAGTIIIATEVEGALQENRVAINLNTAHVTADGSSHTFIDQSVISGASPTFTGGNFTAMDANDVNIADVGTIITATEVEGALQENRTAINLNTAKTTNATHTGDVTGSGALTVDPTAITGKPAATVAAGDLIMVADIDAGNALKQVTASSIGALGGGGASIIVQDEGTPLTTAVTKFNFAGAGVTVTEPVADEMLVTIPGGGGGGATLDQAVAQTAHGFSVNQWVYNNGTIYALADASAAATAESIGIVSAVADVNNFTVQFGGRITGLSGVTKGVAHFLSEVAGTITTTAPTASGTVVKQVLVADSTISGFIFNMQIKNAGTSFLQSFVNANLTAGVLTVSHNLSQKFVQVQIFNNTDQLIIPDDITLTSTSVTTIDLTSFGVLTGTWSVVILSSGNTATSTASDLSIAGQTTNDLINFNGTNWVRTATPSITNMAVTGAAATPPAANTLYKDNVVKSWINFNGSGVIAIRDSFNVSSIVDNGVGQYTVNWDLDFANINYSITTFGQKFNLPTIVSENTDNGFLVGSVNLICVGTIGNVHDPFQVSLIAIGDQ